MYFNLNFIDLDSRSTRASRASPACRSSQVRERSCASRSRCTSSSFRFGSHVARDILAKGTAPPVAALLNWQSEVSADRGGAYRTAFIIAGSPQRSRVVFHRSALIESAIQSMEHAMNRCPVESSLAHVRKSKVRVVLGGRHHTTQRLYHGLCHHDSSASEPCRLSYIRAH